MRLGRRTLHSAQVHGTHNQVFALCSVSSHCSLSFTETFKTHRQD